MSEEKKDPALPAVNEEVFTQHHYTGRPSAPRKLRKSVKDAVEEFGADPVKLLANVVSANITELGVGAIEIETRIQAAKTLMEYMFSKKLELSGDEEKPVQFKGSVQIDYLKVVEMVKKARGE
jgi:predicted transcriptional regulator